MQARIVGESKIIVSIFFNNPPVDQLITLMDIELDTTQKIYTTQDLWDIWQIVRHYISDDEHARKISMFLMGCINLANGKDVEISFV